MNLIRLRIVRTRTQSRSLRPWPWVNIACSGIVLSAPTLLVFLRAWNGSAHPMQIFSLSEIRQQFSVMDVALWLIMNGCIATALWLLQRYMLQPLKRIVQLVHEVLVVIAQESPRSASPLLDMRVVAGDVARFAIIAQDYYRKHQEVSYALEKSRQILAQITLQQEAMLASTNREIIEQYQSVLAYANYLEEHIQQKSADPGLRYDFDDVCESSFNLKLIAGALNLWRSEEEPARQPVPLATLMQQTMLALSPSLDRRAMKLTTAEVDVSVIALSDPAIVAQVLWMMLLGTIRYAAQESTLRMRCLYNHDHSQAIMSIVVSELSAGSLSPEERGAHLVRQMQHLTPHMFAETIRIHANLQLAELLLKRIDATISILPLTSHACEMCLFLPAAPNTPQTT